MASERGADRGRGPLPRQGTLHVWVVSAVVPWPAPLRYPVSDLVFLILILILIVAALAFSLSFILGYL